MWFLFYGFKCDFYFMVSNVIFILWYQMWFLFNGIKCDFYFMVSNVIFVLWYQMWFLNVNQLWYLFHAPPNVKVWHKAFFVGPGAGL